MITMRNLGPTQIEQIFDEMNPDDQLIVYKKAFGIKEIHPEFSRTDCVATAMGYKKCISGSGFYENENG